MGLMCVLMARPAPNRGESSPSVLTSIVHTSTPIMIVTVVIAIMSFYLIALVVWMAIHYRTIAAIPPNWCATFKTCWTRTSSTRPIIDLSIIRRFWRGCSRAESASCRRGLSQAQRAMELANEDATMEMEHRTTYLATVGTLGPMIGLVGTVYGMIMAFQVIALEGSSPQASQLAAGISTALYATLEGIAISIPAIFFYAIYRNRIARLSLEVGMAAEPLLEQFAPGVRPAPSEPDHQPKPGDRRLRPTPIPSLSVQRSRRRGPLPPRPALPSDGHRDVRKKPHALTSQTIGDLKRAQPELDAAPGRGASAHHVLHDAGPFRHEAGGGDQGSATAGCAGRTARDRT